MAQNGVDPTYGWPRFPVGDAPEVGVDEEIVAEYARWRGNRIVDSTAERTAFTSAGYAYKGITWYDTDTDHLYFYDGSGWVAVWEPETAPGSVVPVAGPDITLSNNALYTRDGFLLGTIDWELTSGTLSHADVILTLPVGARPSHEYHAMVSASPSPSVLFQLIIETGGAVKANSPASSRTAGRVSFVVPIPIA